MRGSVAACCGAGIPVVLHEMKPEKRSEAHHSDDFAELVCSNSLRSNELTNAAGCSRRSCAGWADW